ncbi:MAG: DUF1501 domain-containing protein [Roseibacillus sp.]
MPGNRQGCRGPSRRAFLELGAYSLCGLGLNELARATESGRLMSEDDPAVIFVWLPGGPPHMEMYDMKPDAPSEYRGEFRPIPTNNPDLQVCELMPLHAKCADKYNIIRSVHHTFSDHGGGHKRFMTARVPKEPTGTVNDAPAMTSFIQAALKMRNEDAAANGLPTNVALIKNGRHHIDTFALGGAWLGGHNTPFIVTGDPNAEDFKIDSLAIPNGMAERLEDRFALLKGLDTLRRDIDADGSIHSMDEHYRQAVEMIFSERFRKAFDLGEERKSVRERFGRHAWGQRAILARRLIEAGARFVTVVMENPYVSGIKMPKYGTYNWDSHAVNCHLFRDAELRFPIYDQVITAMIEDLYSRGLDQRVLLVVTGEFGRTPKINVSTGSQTKVAQPGRDHWPRAMSMLVSGGGMRTGQVIGATNAKGEHPVERALAPEDIWATILNHLAIDPNQTFEDHGGRPHPILPSGKAVKELLRG